MQLLAASVVNAAEPYLVFSQLPRALCLLSFFLFFYGLLFCPFCCCFCCCYCFNFSTSNRVARRWIASFHKIQQHFCFAASAGSNSCCICSGVLARLCRKTSSSCVFNSLTYFKVSSYAFGVW